MKEWVFAYWYVIKTSHWVFLQLFIIYNLPFVGIEPLCHIWKHMLSPRAREELKLGMVAPSRCHICCLHVQHICCLHVQERVKTSMVAPSRCHICCLHVQQVTYVVPTCKRELKLGMVAPSMGIEPTTMVKSHMLCHWGKMTCHNYGSTCSHLLGGVIWGKKKNDVESRYQAFTTKWVFTKTSLIELFGSYLHNLSAICGDRTHDHVVKSHALYHWAKMACHNNGSTCYRHVRDSYLRLKKCDDESKSSCLEIRSH